jgi:hypothetical protein
VCIGAEPTHASQWTSPLPPSAVIARTTQLLRIVSHTRYARCVRTQRRRGRTTVQRCNGQQATGNVAGGNVATGPEAKDNVATDNRQRATLQVATNKRPEAKDNIATDAMHRSPN